MGDPFWNHSRFQVVMRILVGSVDSPITELTTTDASKANKVRFTKPRLYQFVIAVWRAKDAQSDRVKGREIISE